MQDFKAPQLGHNIIFGLVILFFVIVGFILVSSANAQEATDTPNYWACPYDHAIDYRIEFVGEYTMVGKIIDVDTLGRCAYIVELGELTLELTYEEFIQTTITPPWCTDNLLGFHDMWGVEYEPGIEVTGVTYDMTQQSCWLETNDGFISFVSFIYYLGEPNQRVLTSYSFAQEVSLEGYDITSYEYILTGNQNKTGFGTVGIDIEGNEYSCFAPVCHIPGLTKVITFGVTVESFIFHVPPWVLHDFIREHFVNTALIYPESP